MFKVFILILLFLALGSLALSLLQIIRGQDADSSIKVTRGLTLRISFCLLVFALLIAGTYLGWIHPHGIGR